VTIEASPEAVKSEIARELVRVHEDNYGAGAQNVQVSLHEDFVAVILDVVLSGAEETLVGANCETAVQHGREAFQVAIAPTFKAIVERATGRRVQSFTSRTVIEDENPWSLEVFRLAPEA
jgi:uncharacterized protein YbcI